MAGVVLDYTIPTDSYYESLRFICDFLHTNIRKLDPNCLIERRPDDAQYDKVFFSVIGPDDLPSGKIKITSGNVKLELMDEQYVNYGATKDRAASCFIDTPTLKLLS